MIQPSPPQAQPVSRYARYALFVLTTANVLNYLDRQIISILAQDIKTDLGLTDAELGFLMGTAFAVFYSILGVGMGRIADAVTRTRMMAIGLALWSAMTALSATATGYVGLATARAGVGIGEAAANPCSLSLLSQYFPASRRALALGTYLSGAFLGSAAALILGGYLVQDWGTLCHLVPIGEACSVKPWKAAFVIVASPGLVLALLVASLREPPRPSPATVKLGPLIVAELCNALPPFTLLSIYRTIGAGAALKNLMLAAGIAIGAWLLIALTGDTLQWSAIGLGVYSVSSWLKLLSMRDPALFGLTFGCPTFRLVMLGGALIACVTGAVSTWAAPYALRVLGMSPGEAGVTFGLIIATASAMGVALGGWITDQWKRRDLRAPVWVGLIGLIGPQPALAVMLTTSRPATYLIAYFFFALFATGWSGAFAALVQDLSLSRMRGAAGSMFAMVSVLVASGTGPYWAGKVSTVTGSLALGMAAPLLLAPVTIFILILLARRLPGETMQARQQRAEAFGEPGQEKLSQIG